MAELRRRRLGALVLVILSLAGCRRTEDAVTNGDRLWADSNFTGALAEYRLALRRRADDPAVLARVAHAYAVTGRLAPARETYGRLLAVDSSYAPQAVFDYLGLAEGALARGDRYSVAASYQAAAALRPGLPVGAYAPVLARYYGASGEPERALAYYRQALEAMPPDSAPALLYETALLEESRGNCGTAIDQFREYRERAPRGPHAEEARWHVGNCAFELAKQFEAAGRPDDALAQLALVLDLGVPQNLQDQAWFHRGELLFAQGRRDEALAAYQRVLDLNPARMGSLVERAQQRIDQIRFGT
ncbi:MAG TPA: tetratricopeptide repeat protein [Longimicrobiales bacterium]|nr:tetratricopeptide repeat protein [Longimicrobiales bacterium]